MSLDLTPTDWPVVARYRANPDPCCAYLPDACCRSLLAGDFPVKITHWARLYLHFSRLSALPPP
ncbi:MAG: hypothetical protein NTZ29_06240, partial [Verrucomicrobia bacterium]|nr:hypothetical protein [Verrucomicrobiota bacterium]